MLETETRALGEGSPDSGARRREEGIHSSPQGQEIGKCFATETEEEGMSSSGLSQWLNAMERGAKENQDKAAHCIKLHSLEQPMDVLF